MALIDITDKISHATDNKLYSAGIFIDPSKAFDTFDHLIMLSKLEHYGISGIPPLYMLFSGKCNRVSVTNFSLHIDNTIIKRIDNCNVLCVNLDENLSWSVDIDKISKTIGCISRIRYKFDSTMYATQWYFLT